MVLKDTAGEIPRCLVFVKSRDRGLERWRKSWTAQQAGTRLLCFRTTSYPVFPLSPYFNPNKPFWPACGGLSQKHQSYPQLFAEHFAGSLVFLRIFVYNASCWVLSMRRCGMNGARAISPFIPHLRMDNTQHDALYTNIRRNTRLPAKCSAKSCG